MLRELAAAVVVLLMLPAPLTAACASARIDTAHRQQHRQSADNCILDAVIIYTDPYIGGRLTNREVVANIAQMCAGPFALYSEDLALDDEDAQRLLRQVIEAGLRGQFRLTGDQDTTRPADR